jgi:hypothetical protein
LEPWSQYSEEETSEDFLRRTSKDMLLDHQDSPLADTPDRFPNLRVLFGLEEVAHAERNHEGPFATPREEAPSTARPSARGSAATLPTTKPAGKRQVSSVVPSGELEDFTPIGAADSAAGCA